MKQVIVLCALLAIAHYAQANAVAVEYSASSPVCAARNSYYPMLNSCDSYIECKEYQANEMLCPDGLHYNPKAVWPDYPCSYPSDVSCEGRGPAQPAQPTAECPHRYGFFKSSQAHASNCGQYRMCVDGVAIEMMCPPGLAFNPENARCDWPDLVPGCTPELFLNFQCPPAPLGEDGEPLPIVNYKYEDDCYNFYSCEHGHPRLLSCDPGFAYDSEAGHCIDAEKASCANKK